LKQNKKKNKTKNKKTKQKILYSHSEGNNRNIWSFKIKVGQNIKKNFEGDKNIILRGQIQRKIFRRDKTIILGGQNVKKIF
jgi:hypothetical protein